MANFDSFATGFAQQQLSPEGYLGGQLQDIEQRRKDRLAMAMESAKIQAETEGRIQQESAKYNLENKLDPTFGSQVANLMFPGQNITPTNNKNLEDLTRIHTADQMNVFKQLSKPVGNGLPVKDPQYGIEIGRQPANALGNPIGRIETYPNAANKLKDAETVATFQQDLGNLKSEAAKINFGRLQGFLNKGAGYLGVNSDVTNFENLRTRITTEMPKFLAGMTRFNDPEFKRLSEAASTISTPQEMAGYFSQLDNAIENRQRAIGMYGKSIPDQATPPPVPTQLHTGEKSMQERYNELGNQYIKEGKTAAEAQKMAHDQLYKEGYR